MSEQQGIFEPPHDVIELPSKGMFYKHKTGKIKVAYLTAQDENTLTSPNLLQNGEVLDELLKNKILTPGINADELLSGDRNAILFFLRATGYGEIYPIKLVDPQTQQEFDYDVDLSKINEKPINVSPDENGEVAFILPKTGKNIKFRYLTAIEESRIVEQEEVSMKATGRKISQLMTKKLEQQITEIDGDRSRAEILQFINYMPVADSSALRKFMNDNKPGLDTDIEVSAPSGAVFHTEIPITLSFFWPYL